MKNVLIIMLVFVALNLWSNSVPVVTITSINQRIDGSMLIDIYYDLDDADANIMTVSLQVSNDGGSSYIFSCTMVTGDIGSGISSGNGKHIIWDAGTEHPDIWGDNFFFKVIADDGQTSGGSGTVTDIDGNVYLTVIIGNQEWMAENLKVTRYRDGNQIPHVTDNSTWTSTTSGAYCEFGNHGSYVNTYGRLYNWYAVADSRGLAPEGWRVPSDADIKQLEMALGMTQEQADATGFRGTNQGSQLAGRTDLWFYDALEEDSQFGSSGFNFLPGGYRDGNSGDYDNLRFNGFFWSSTEYYSDTAWSRVLSFSATRVYRYDTYKRNGFSVRCVRDID